MPTESEHAYGDAEFSSARWRESLNRTEINELIMAMSFASVKTLAEKMRELKPRVLERLLVGHSLDEYGLVVYIVALVNNSDIRPFSEDPTRSQVEIDLFLREESKTIIENQIPNLTYIAFAALSLDGKPDGEYYLEVTSSYSKSSTFVGTINLQGDFSEII